MVIARQITTVVTGVAGSPYYISAFFLADETTVTADKDMWHTFITTGTASRLVTNSTWTTLGTGPEIDTTTGDQVGFYTGGDIAITGTSTDPFLPPATQMLIKWGTGVVQGGRRIRGRTFHPLHAESENTQFGRVEPTAVTDMNARATTLITAAQSRFGVYSRKNGTLSPISSFTVNGDWSVLRSRRTK